MKERLIKLLTHLGYTATKLADEIGVQRSGISHILSGRNQPSYDFIAKMLSTFPKVSAEWLIMGNGPMLKIENSPIITEIVGKSGIQGSGQQELFALPGEKTDNKAKKESIISKVTYVTHINKVILLNSDGTFEVYQQAEQD
jgi:transcriptional regulator with XRE-family HTH domain